MAAGVGVQGLLGGAERVEQPHGGVPRMAFIVPLHDELDRDRDPCRDRGEPVAADKAEDRGGDPGLGREEADAHLAPLGQAVVPDRPAVADGIQLLECVQRGLPVGDELRRHHLAEGRPRRAGGLTRGQPFLDDRDEPPYLRVLGPVAGSRRVDRGDRETAEGNIGDGPGQHAGFLLVLAATVPDQDQRAGTSTRRGRPQHARRLPDREELLADPAGHGFRGDAHDPITSALPPAPRANYKGGHAASDDAGGPAVSRQQPAPTIAPMSARVKVAVVGVGNNVSALVQGIARYRATGSLAGIRRPVLDGIGVADIDFVAAFATSAEKIGTDLCAAIFLPPNNYPRLTSELPACGVTVRRGLTGAGPGEVERVAGDLNGAEVVLYAAPSGRPQTAQAYAEVALRAGAAFVNTTADAVARDPRLLERYAAAGLPLLGDDLASQFGTSVVHHALLRLLAERGLTLTSSYQVNLGGTEDFRNLTEHGNTKHQSKLNALGADGSAAGRVQVAPLGYLPHLGSQKVAYINIEAQAWGETPVSVDVKLTVHDPSGAAGVNVDLVRIAASALRQGRGGYPAEATPLLKSPPGTPV
jgi:myo-inositol-1-phosphate synthase